MNTTTPLLLVTTTRCKFFARERVLDCLDAAFSNNKEDNKVKKAYDKFYKEQRKMQREIDSCEQHIVSSGNALKKLRSRESAIACMEDDLQNKQEERKDLIAFELEIFKSEIKKINKKIIQIEKRISKAKNQKQNYDLKRKIEVACSEEEDFSRKKKKLMADREAEREKASDIIDSWENINTRQNCMINAVPKLDHERELRTIKFSIEKGNIGPRINTYFTLKVLVQKNLLRRICQYMTGDFFQSCNAFMELQQIKKKILLLRGTCSNLYWTVTQLDIENDDDFWDFLCATYSGIVFKKS